MGKLSDCKIHDGIPLWILRSVDGRPTLCVCVWMNIFAALGCVYNAGLTKEEKTVWLTKEACAQR